LVFVKDKIKVGDGWASPLLAALGRHPSALVGPVVHTLDLHLWATEPTRWRRFGWRWDLNLYDRQSPAHQTESPAVSSYCLAVTKGWFNDLGGFDDGMVSGSGEDLELSLRCWLLGGSVLVCDDSNTKFHKIQISALS
jgi:polypeptide N-acetylgalactosaminyltransferase